MSFSEPTILASLAAVVFVFLFSVEKFSAQIHSLAGDRFKLFLQKATDTPWKGVASGAFVTSILQSSTAMSVLLVSLADAGLLPLANSLAVIIGANIGTTITTQLVAFKILNIAPYILILGFLLIKTKTKYRYLGKPVFYFGLLFSSLLILSIIAGAMSEMWGIKEILSSTSNLFIAILLGFVASNIFQSSSLTTSVVIILVLQNTLSFEQAFGIILGTNIGTTTTALIASLVTGKQGKRVAVGHFIFNVIGVLVFIPFVGPFAKFVTGLPISLVGQVALSHFLFNIIIAGIFLIGFKYFERAVHRLVP